MMSYQSIEISSESTPFDRRSESGKKSGSWQKKVVVILGVVALVAVGAALMGSSSSSSVGGANQNAQDRSQLVQGTAPNQRGLENLIGDAVEADKLPSSKCPDTRLCNDKCRATCPNSWVPCYIGCLNSVACVGACPKQMVDLTKQSEKELSSDLAQGDGAFPSACADMQSCHDTCRATCPSGWVSCYIGCLNSATCAKTCPKMIGEQEGAIAAAVDGLPKTKCSDMLSCNMNCRAFCPNSWVSCYTGCLESPTCAPTCPTKQLKKEEGAIAAAVDGLPATKCSDMLSCNEGCRSDCPNSWVSCYIGCLDSPTCAKTCPKMTSERLNGKKEAAAADGVALSKCGNMLSCNEECRSTCPNSWVSCYIGCLNSPTCMLPSCPKAMLREEQEVSEYGDDDVKKEGNL